MKGYSKDEEDNYLQYDHNNLVSQNKYGMSFHKVSRDQMIYAAFICFGLSAYALILGLWAEVAALYQILPEGAELSAYFVVALQCANVAPFTYMALTKKGADVHVKTTIYVILVTGAITSVLLANFYDTTVYVWGSQRSVILLFIFMAGMASTTTNVCYFPFVSRFRKKFTTALTVGQGLAGFLFGALGIIQGSGKATPRFSIGTYFYCCFAVYVVAAVAFRYLEQAECLLQLEDKEQLLCESDSRDELMAAMRRRSNSNSLTGSSSAAVEVRQLPQWVLLAIQFWLAAMGYGFIPSIITLLCANYQDSSTVIQWATVLGMTADPLSRLLTASAKIRGNAQFLPLTFWSTVFATILALIAFKSPQPPFFNQQAGGIFPVVSYTAFMLTFAFTNTMIYFGLRRLVEEGAVEDVYRWSGFITQCGSFVGTILAFSLILSGLISYD